MKLSKKKEEHLYGIVHEDIMQARIKIARLLNGLPSVGIPVDDILSDLCIKAPQDAIGLFKSQ